MLAGRRTDDGAATVVHLILLMPLLTAALAAVMHLGLHLLSRQAATTAVQEGLTIASGIDGTPVQGQAVATQIISDHSAAEILDLSTSTTATTVTMTATLRTPSAISTAPTTSSLQAMLWPLSASQWFCAGRDASQTDR